MIDAQKTTSSGAIHALANALEILKLARRATTQGFADDHCCNAIQQIKAAIRVEVEALTQSD